MQLSRPDDIMACPPIALEVGFSTRDPEEHGRLIQQFDAFAGCDLHPSVEEALAVQHTLWDAGLLRAAGSVDTLIAAYAIKNDAVIVHYDRDFELIASVVPALRQRWIVARGSI